MRNRSPSLPELRRGDFAPEEEQKHIRAASSFEQSTAQNRMNTLVTDQSAGAEEFRVVLLSGAPPRVLARLISEISRSAGRHRITGVLYWVRKPLPLPKRIANFVSQLHRPAYLQYVVGRLVQAGRGFLRKAARFAWQTVHAHYPKDETFGVEQLRDHCESLGIPFQTTDRFHSEESLAFVAEGQPDLGIVYGTPILQPSLFEIPRLGSVNLHQRKVPDYRGGGPVGLWEMLDGEKEIGVTVHRVARKLDAGAVVRSTVIPIDPADTLASLEMKAHVTGIDLLTAAVRDFSTGRVTESPQVGEGRMFRNPKPEALAGILRQLDTVRKPAPTTRTYPLWKLLIRFCAFVPWLTVRNWYRRLTGTFPLVVLYHHLITDRPHFMGMSTDQFMAQLEYLRRYYDIVDFATGQRLLESGRITRPTVVLTFDDGYRDNVLNLRAAVLKTQVPALLYVCSDHLESGQPFAHDVERGYHGFEPMTWDEARTLHAWGIRFGAHTRTHFDCGSTDSVRLQTEIADCRKRIEEELGAPIGDFSFPFGLQHNISHEGFQLATEHYETVASAYGGVNTCGQEGRQHVYRIPHPTCLMELELLLQSVLVFGQPGYWTGPKPAAAQVRPSQPPAELVEL